MKYSFLFFLVILFATTTLFSCKKAKTDVGEVLFSVSKNKIYKKMEAARYEAVFKEVLTESRSKFSNPKVIEEFYSQNDYEPYFILNFSEDNQFKILTEKLKQAPLHGLDPEFFNLAELNHLSGRIYDKKGVKTIDEVYRSVARLELITANSLINYSNILQYGAVNPNKLFARYYVKTKRPDQVSMKKIFEITDLRNYLDSIQPKDPKYKLFQNALSSNYIYPGKSREETAKLIRLNMERLRWKTVNTNAERYIWVNIPDFSLKFFDHDKPVLSMKVCVGEAKDIDYYEKLKAFNDSAGMANRPSNHETPILGSEIHTIVVKPVWNIPRSIGQSEIAVKAAENPNYLADQNIGVYYKGKKIESDTIDWKQAALKKIKYDFKQAPGEGNALGKVKFLFDNSSSVYLHDTPAKEAFKRDNRAISHGCVRVEDPLALANAIVNSDAEYEKLAEKFNDTTTASKSFHVQKKVPVYLDYKTCWIDEEGKVQIRADVYHLDKILYQYLEKYLTKNPSVIASNNKF